MKIILQLLLLLFFSSKKTQIHLSINKTHDTNEMFHYNIAD